MTQGVGRFEVLSNATASSANADTPFSKIIGNIASAYLQMGKAVKAGFERRRVDPKFRTPEHFWLMSVTVPGNEGEQPTQRIYPVPREILIDGENYTFTENGAAVSKDANPGIFNPSVELSPRSIVKKGAKFSGRVALGYGATIGEFARITNSVIGDNATVGPKCQIEKSQLGFIEGEPGKGEPIIPDVTYLRSGRVFRRPINVGEDTVLFRAFVHGPSEIGNDVRISGGPRHIHVGQNSTFDNNTGFEGGLFKTRVKPGTHVVSEEDPYAPRRVIKG